MVMIVYTLMERLTTVKKLVNLRGREERYGGKEKELRKGEREGGWRGRRRRRRKVFMRLSIGKANLSHTR